MGSLPLASERIDAATEQEQMGGREMGEELDEFSRSGLQGRDVLGRVARGDYCCRFNRVRQSGDAGLGERRREIRDYGGQSQRAQSISKYHDMYEYSSTQHAYTVDTGGWVSRYLFSSLIPYLSPCRTSHSLAHGKTCKTSPFSVSPQRLHDLSCTVITPHQQRERGKRENTMGTLHICIFRIL